MEKTMKFAKFLAVVVVMIFLLFMGGAFAYKFFKSQGVVEPYSINRDQPNQPRVLIAAQKRNFKDSVMEIIRKKYTDMPIFISVIDVTKLDTVTPSDWDGIVLFTTIESSNPPQIVLNFLEQQANLSNKFLVLTADSEEWRSENTTGIDVMTSASSQSSIIGVSEKIITKINSFIK